MVEAAGSPSPEFSGGALRTPSAAQNKRLRRLTLAVGAPLFLFGVCLGALGSTYTWAVAWFGGPQLMTTEFPLGYPANVAVDSQGRIYVAEDIYTRVQRYSPQGKFELGWSVPTGGHIALRTTRDDHIQVASTSNEFFTYSAEGVLLSSEPAGHVDLEGQFEANRETAGGYAVRRGLLPDVVDTRTGRTVIATPWQKRLIAAPFPACAYAAIGVALIALSELLRRRAGRTRASA